MHAGREGERGGGGVGGGVITPRVLSGGITDIRWTSHEERLGLFGE